jgi:hypothetical protein
VAAEVPEELLLHVEMFFHRNWTAGSLNLAEFGHHPEDISCVGGKKLLYRQHDAKRYAKLLAAVPDELVDKAANDLWRSDQGNIKPYVAEALLAAALEGRESPYGLEPSHAAKVFVASVPDSFNGALQRWQREVALPDPAILSDAFDTGRHL